MSSPPRDDDSTESPVLLLAELLRAAGVADQLADRTLRTKFFGTSAALEAAASWDHVEASIQALERDLAKVAASIEATSASPALSAIHRAAKKTLSELGDELETKEREKSEIARDFADVWKTWKRQYEHETLQRLRDEKNARRAAAKGPERRSNKTRPPCDSDDPDAAEEFESAPGGKPNAKSWPGRPLDPPCARCARRETDCHAHENGLKWRRVSCFECNASHVACSLSKNVADRQPAPRKSKGGETERQGGGGKRRVFGPRSVQEAATRKRNAARVADADAEAKASVRAPLDRLNSALDILPKEYRSRCVRALSNIFSEIGAGLEALTQDSSRAGQKRKRAAADD